MENIQKPKASRRKKIIIGVIIVLALGLLAVATMAFTKTGLFAEDQSDNTDTSMPSDQQTNPASDLPGTAPNKTPAHNEPSGDPTPQDTLKASITAANQNGDVLQIRTLIETVSSEGTCRLALTKNDQTVTRTANVQALASSSTCQGFDIPVSELSAGTWELVIEITVDDKNARLTQSVDVT